MTVIALLFSIILVYSHAAMDTDTKTDEELLKLLPGYQCGTCGYGSCNGMVEAMKKNKENYKKCKLLKGDAYKEMDAYIRKLNEKR